MLTRSVLLLAERRCFLMLGEGVHTRSLVGRFLRLLEAIRRQIVTLRSHRYRFLSARFVAL